VISRYGGMTSRAGNDSSRGGRKFGNKPQRIEHELTFAKTYKYFEAIQDVLRVKVLIAAACVERRLHCEAARKDHQSEMYRLLGFGVSCTARGRVPIEVGVLVSGRSTVVCGVEIMEFRTTRLCAAEPWSSLIGSDVAGG